jgi:hypothetical protein
MFASLLISGMLCGFVSGILRLKFKQKKKIETPKTVEVSIDDCTKMHTNAFDTVLEILGMEINDAVSWMRAVISEATSEKLRREDEGERISIRRAIKQIAEIKFNTGEAGLRLRVTTDGEFNSQFDVLVSVIAKYYTKNPLDDVMIDDINYKDSEKESIFADMFHTYASKGLTAKDLQSIMITRKRRKITIQNKVEKFLVSKKGSKEAISRKSLRTFFGLDDLNAAWKYIRENSDKLQKEYDITINNRSVPHMGDIGNFNWRPEKFILQSGKKSVGTKFFYGQAQIRYDLTGRQPAIKVLKGSQARFELSPTFDPIDPKTGKVLNTANSTKRNWLIDNGILKFNSVEQCYEFTQDYEFDATSLAANIVCGARKTGHDAWVVEGTKPKKTLQTLNHEQFPQQIPT